MATRVVVTGAAGFIGSHLCEDLLARGHDVVGIDAFTDYYDPRIKRENVARAAASPGFRLLEGSLTSLDLSAALDGAATVQDGKLSSCVTYDTHAEALASAGLEEHPARGPGLQPTGLRGQSI